MVEKITESEMYDRYNEHLNDVSGEWLLQKYEVSDLFESVDEVAYNEDFSNYQDNLSEEVIIKGGDYDTDCEECGEKSIEDDHECEPEEKLVHKVGKLNRGV